MKLRVFAAISMLMVGLGAVALAVVGPGLAASSGPKYITAAAQLQTVAAQAVANGTIGANTVFGLRFGAPPDIISSASPSSTSSSSSSSTGGTSGSSAGSSGSSGSVTWPVMSVTATVGQQVKQGAVLATADSSAAKLQLASAQASLEAAQAKLTTDQAGPDATTKAAAAVSVTQAQNQLNQAIASRKTTSAQNSLKLSQAKQAVTDAQNKLNTDTAAGQPATVISQDQAGLANAQANLATVELQVQASNQQAAQAVTNAQLGLQAAQTGYATKVAPATSAVIAADQAQVASAQTAVTSAQAAANASTITAPADGLIIAVNVRNGVDAPSGYAIEMQSGGMVATASFAETAIPSLKVGQPASVTVSAVQTTLDGTVSQIAPVASTSGGSSSVVTFSVTVTLNNAPATVMSGMSATVTVTTASVDNALAVPATALRGSADAGYTVQVMNSDGSITVVPVQVGLVTASMAQITGGLNAGQEVVTGTVASRNNTTTTSNGINLGGLSGGGGGRFVNPGGNGGSGAGAGR